jgi:hypothetical protein
MTALRRFFGLDLRDRLNAVEVRTNELEVTVRAMVERF